MHPLDRIEDRLSSLYRQVEAGEPIDFAKQHRLAALDLVEAGVHFTREAIETAEKADAEMMQMIESADGQILT